MAGGAWVLRRAAASDRLVSHYQHVWDEIRIHYFLTGADPRRAQVAHQRSGNRDFSRSRRRGPASSRRRSRVFRTPSTQTVTTQVAYFGWYQMHAKVQSDNIKEYYEQNPTTGEEIGQ